jgi:hypothetical protein
MVLVVKPHSMTGRVTSKKIMTGTGMGSVLLNGSAGVAATMTSAAPTLQISKGSGLGNELSAKLSKLTLQAKKKPSNIKFSI